MGSSFLEVSRQKCRPRSKPQRFAHQGHRLGARLRILIPHWGSKTHRWMIMVICGHKSNWMHSLMAKPWPKLHCVCGHPATDIEYDGHYTCEKKIGWLSPLLLVRNHEWSSQIAFADIPKKKASPDEIGKVSHWQCTQFQEWLWTNLKLCRWCF